MTEIVIDDILPRTQATATNGQTVFNTNWTADVATDIDVYARASGVDADDETQIVSPSLYNVTFVGSQETVRVTFLSGRTLNDVITIVRNTPSTRENLYTNTNFTPSMLNQDFGLLTLVDQQAQLYDELVAPHYNVSATIDPIVDVILPILAENQIWAMAPDRTAIIPYDVPEGGGLAPAGATYLLQTSNPYLYNAQVMGDLASGFVVNTNSTGVQLSRIITGTANQVDVTNGTGISGNPTLGISANAIFPGNEGLGLVRGTTAQRPVTPGANTNFRFNTDLVELEYWDGSAWVQLVEDAGVLTVSGTVDRITVNNTDPANPIVDIANTYVGQTSLTTLGTITTGTWNATTLATGFGGTGLTSYVLGDILYSNATNSLAALAGNITSTKKFLSQTGTGAVSAAPGWEAITGTDITGAELSRVNDTNVTLTLGGTPTQALLRDTSLTLGWTGQLAVGRGGTGLGTTPTAGQILIGNGTNYSLNTLTAGTNISIDNSTPGQITISNTASGSVSPGIQYELAWYATTGSTVSGFAMNDYAVLVSGADGVPTSSAGLLDGEIIVGTTGGAPSAASITAGAGITVTPGPGSITIASTGGGGSGTVNTGDINEVAWYAANGNVVSGLTTANNGVLVTSAGGVPSISTTLPNSLAMGTPASLTLTNATGLPIGGIAATGTPGSSNFLRGDGTWTAAGTGAVDSVVGTADRITVDSSTPSAPIVNIASTYVGQNSITTLGTVTTGAWNATAIGFAYGGTGLTATPTAGQLLIGNNSGYTLATLTAGSNITVDNSTPGAITINSTASGSGTVNSGTANQIAYYATTGTAVSGLTGANSAMLVTNSSGVPAMTASMTDGQIIIGDTSGTPVPATLTAGTGIDITNAAGSITISQLPGNADPYDMAFSAGYSSAGTAVPLAVQDYGFVVAGRGGSITSEAANLNTAATGSALIMDIKKNGTTVYTTKPQFAVSSQVLTPGVLKTDGTEDFVAGDLITFAVTQKGSTVAGSGLTFTAITNYISGNPYDMAFIGGFSASGTAVDLVVQSYGYVVAGRMGTITSEEAYLNTASSGADVILDILKNNVSVYTTKPEFAAGSTTLTAGTLKSDGTQNFVPGDIITFAVTQIGSGTAGAGVAFTVVANF